MELINAIVADISEFKGVKFSVDYSVGEKPNVAEFEGIHVIPGQGLTEDETQRIEKLLECGEEERLVKDLKEHYRDSGIIFINPHE